MQNYIDLKEFKVYLPDGDRRSFYIYGDLRNLLGTKNNFSCIKKLKESLQELDFKPQPKFTFTELHAGIQSKDALIIFLTIEKLMSLSVDKSKTLNINEMTSLKEKLLNWVAPKPQKWKMGDIFSLELEDESFAFGQIIGPHPTVALFDYKKDLAEISYSELLDKKILSIIHTTTINLNNWSWKVLDNYSPLANKDDGPSGTDTFQIGLQSFSPNVLDSIANYYWFRTCDWADEESLKDLIIKDKNNS
ncbi:MAG: hypothetical protein EOO91_09790 [Pedobacter sp.]|nr:MAG: hypothetical protein EOO91_09790 [Pedobacter sp.]